MVLLPDDLGLGVSQPHAEQGYLNRDIVSAVALELLRGAQQNLLARPRRFRPNRVPELWLMGGSHGGYITTAMQWRLQEANSVLRDGQPASLYRFVTTGSFMEAAPIDVSGNVLDQFTSTRPCAKGMAFEPRTPSMLWHPCYGAPCCPLSSAIVLTEAAGSPRVPWKMSTRGTSRWWESR